MIADRGMLVLVDQHAAHERIRLEVLTEGNQLTPLESDYL